MWGLQEALMAWDDLKFEALTNRPSVLYKTAMLLWENSFDDNYWHHIQVPKICQAIINYGMTFEAFWTVSSSVIQLLPIYTTIL